MNPSLDTAAITADLPLISIIIPNYNYAAYVGEAIASALLVAWARVEVIVVDDGSTDGSRAVISSFEPSVRAIYQPNGGHTAACYAGYLESRGDWIIFLDSDDTVSPGIIELARDHLLAGVSKVQFQMRTITASGAELGTVYPAFPAGLSPADITRAFTESGGYPTPPCSANLFARAFLEQIFPPERYSPTQDLAMDSYTLAAAPLLGKVVTIAEPAVGYRIHGRNDSGVSGIDATKIAINLARARWRAAYVKAIGTALGVPGGGDMIRHSFPTLSLRVALAGTDLGEPRLRIIGDILGASRRYQGFGRREHRLYACWLLLCAALPRCAAAPLLRWKMAPATRPDWLKRLGRRPRPAA